MGHALWYHGRESKSCFIPEKREAGLTLDVLLTGLERSLTFLSWIPKSGKVSFPCGVRFLIRVSATWQLQCAERDEAVSLHHSERATRHRWLGIQPDSG